MTDYGQTWRIKVGDGADPEVFVTIGGEVSFDWERSSKEIDTSSKDDGYLASTGYGSQKITITPNGKLKLPDPGLSKLVAASKAVPPTINVEIVSGEVVQYAGEVAVGNFSTTHPNDDVCTWKCTLAASAVPTTDNLGATA